MKFWLVELGVFMLSLMDWTSVLQMIDLIDLRTDQKFILNILNYKFIEKRISKNIF